MQLTSAALEAKMIEKGIRPTPVRSLVLRALAEASRPLSAQDIEDLLDTVDRSSITRTVAIFRDLGLIHAIADGTDTVKYELCPGPHNHTPADEHIHFHCTRCGRTVCLPLPVPSVELPEGYTPSARNFVISGLCPACHK